MHAGNKAGERAQNTDSLNAVQKRERAAIQANMVRLRDSWHGYYGSVKKKGPCLHMRIVQGSN